MEPKHLRFGGGVGQTIVNPIVLLVVLIAGLLICFGGRRKALAAFLVGAMLIPVDQILLIGSLHFPMLRVLILFGGIRMLRAKFSGARLLGAGWNRIDPGMIVLTMFIAVNGVLLYGSEQAVVVYQLGNIYSAFGAYFLLRHLIRDDADVMLTIRTFAYIALIVAAIMTYEQATGKNPYYAYLGGAHASMYGSALERGARFRATGCFGHPILAGTFGAISFPLFAGLWRRERKYRLVAVMGIGSAAIIAWAANSSTSLVGFAAGAAALCLWPLRKYMRPLRWAILLALVNLQLVMKAPVWHLITRIDVTGSSSSYHRYQLINQCILHFSDWWLIGTKNYADWGWDLWDLSDQYVGIADVSGLLPLLAFVAMIVFAFKYVGKSRRIAPDKKQEWFVWALGASLFANVVAFFGIGYFDQTIVAWYALLAMIPVVAHSIRKARQAEAQEAAPDEIAQAALETEPETMQIPNLV
jgi:hypothetical protein